MGSKERERIKLWNGSVSLSEEERDVKTTLTPVASRKMRAERIEV